jgi:hypothetical protein
VNDGFWPCLVGHFSFAPLWLLSIVLQGLYAYLPPTIFDVNRGRILVITSFALQ